MSTRFALSAFLLLLAATACAQSTRYLVRPVYSNLRFSIVKWGVMKEEGMFRDFTGTLDYDPAHPEKARIDVVASAASLDTKDETRDGVVRSDDFLDVARYPTIEFHSRGVDHDVVTGDLTIHGVTRRIHFPVTSLGIRDVPHVGKLAGFETAFAIDRRDFGVLGNRWGAIPGVLSDEVEIQIAIGAVQPEK
ncbi:MAG TPA: YceI family protein [Thermoanaerobaculia bacterium]|nr:YceI family protein [Thermoanaerobaculia bacterium]